MVTGEASISGARRCVPAARCAALIAASVLIAVAQAPTAAADSFQPPPVRHVWVINLENTSYSQTFEDGGNVFGAGVPPHPYLKDVLPSRGLLLRQYYGIGHNSLDNYIAEVSGQSPTPDTQGDCLSGTDFAGTGTDPHGQAIGQGCVYPASVKTIADQLDAKGMTWKGYMQDLGNTGAAPGQGDGQFCGRANGYQQTDLYVAKHNPYVWFHSLVDDERSCETRVLPLTAMGRDLQSVATTPNLSFITPNLCEDAHESECGLPRVDELLKRWVPLIQSSPAYRQDGMVVVTFDEASSLVGVSGGDDTAACCNEIPGPNTPMPGISGPGGGRVGAVILSPYVKPGTTSDTPYNHYSLLRSFEDLFGISSGGDDGHGHLGFAGSYDPTYPGPGSFGCDVYNVYGPCQSPTQAPGRAPSPAGSGQPTGPRPADGSAKWLNALPTSNDLTSISCPSASACFAAGEAGTIVATKDSGATWSSQGSGTASDLAGISCATASTCVAVGGFGTIVETTDGGATWTKKPSGTAAELNGVSCTTSSRCSAVGSGGTIIATHDAGQSWSSQTSGTDSALRGVSCASASTCYAVGDLYVTHPGSIPGTTGYTAGVLITGDGGSTWTPRDTNTLARRLHSISCPTASTCFAGGDAEVIVATGNGGSTWSQKFAPSQRSLGLACASVTDCVAVGTHLASFDTRPAGAIASTGNGSTFSIQSSGTSDDLRGVSCATATTCYAVGDRGTIVAKTDGFNWRTQSQTATPVPPPLASPREPPTRAPQLMGTSCPTTSACFAVGDGGLLTVAHDSGSHWSAQTSSTSERLYAISCATATDCVAAGDGGTIVGTSNGSLWSMQNSGTAQALVAVSCPTASRCFTVGDQGTILSTTDHGASWHSQRSNTNANLNAVSCSSSSTCVAVGSLGTILKTTNGGSTWDSRSAGIAAYLGGVTCPTAKSCYAVGQDGAVLATTDGAKTWSAKHAGVGDELNSISCVSASSCVVSGSAGTVLSSANGGTSWTVQGTGTARDLMSASCPSTTSCFAAGDAGTLLRITPKARR